MDRVRIAVAVTMMALSGPSFAQAPPAAAPAGPAAQTAARDNMANDQTLKSADDLLWHLKLGDIAEVDKVSYASLPPHNEPNKTAQGAGNPVIIYAYTFIPRKLDRTRQSLANDADVIARFLRDHL